MQNLWVLPAESEQQTGVFVIENRIEGDFLKRFWKAGRIAGGQGKMEESGGDNIEQKKRDKDNTEGGNVIDNEKKASHQP